MKKVCHLTSAHNRFDTRIFVKQCQSIALIGYETHLVVADGKGDEIKNGVKIWDTGKQQGRLARMRKATKAVYAKALKIDADIYHAHDPELLPTCVKLKKKGKHVVFDAHEDLPKQLLSKPYLTPSLLKVVSRMAAYYETKVCAKLDAVVAATPYIRDKFLRINPETVDVNNYPKLEEFTSIDNWSSKEKAAVYVGGLSKIRGIKEIVDSLRYTDGVKLNLGGRFSEGEYKTLVTQSDQWNKVNELGFLNRQEVANSYNRSRVGLVTLHPTINYLDSLPVKMFEYMASGLPVIASDFPLWKEIISSSQCGVCVDPLSPAQIGKQIQWMIDNPEEAKKMGDSGRKAVEERYNWTIEMNKLNQLYSKILSN